MIFMHGSMRPDVNEVLKTESVDTVINEVRLIPDPLN